MPGTTIGRGNILYDYLVAQSITWAAVNANTTAEQNVTVKGLVAGDYADLYSQNAAQTTGLTVVNIRCTANDVLTVQWVNSTAGALTPVAGVYLTNICRAESFSNLATSAV